METLHERIEAGGIGRQAIELRRQLHRQPELSEREHATMALLADRLGALGIPCVRNVADTGLVGLIQGGGDGPTVALRADIDALPIQEENPDLPYASQTPGVMHACGHDIHTAVLWGTAAVLAGMRERLRGNVKLLFQPAEESIGGAARMRVKLDLHRFFIALPHGSDDGAEAREGRHDEAAYLFFSQRLRVSGVSVSEGDGREVARVGHVVDVGLGIFVSGDAACDEPSSGDRAGADGGVELGFVKLAREAAHARARDGFGGNRAAVGAVVYFVGGA